MKVDLRLASSPWTAINSGLTITDIDIDALTVTVDAAVTSLATHGLFSPNVIDATPASRTYVGIDGIASASNPSSGNLYGIDRTTTPNFRANEFDLSVAAGAPGTPQSPTETALLAAFHRVNSKTGHTYNKNNSFMVASHGVYRAVAKYLEGRIRTMESISLKSGVENVIFLGLPLIADARHAAESATIVDKDYTQILVLNPAPETNGPKEMRLFNWRPAPKGSGVIYPLEGSDNYRGVLITQHALVATNPANWLRVKEIAEASI
jgi:hypothetical protein